MTELTFKPREQDFQPNLVEVEQCKSFTDAINRLKKLPPGIALFDSDNTMREPLKEGRVGKFGKIPSEVLNQVDDLKEKGWEIAIVTNQPEKGHQVAKVVSKVRGDYETFPDCFKRRNIEIFGGGWGFLIKHFKKSSEAVRKVQNWIKKKGAGFKGKVPVVMIGDREGDIKFTDRLAEEIQEEEFVRNIKMLKLPGKEKGLARLTP